MKRENRKPTPRELLQMGANPELVRRVIRPPKRKQGGEETLRRRDNAGGRNGGRKEGER